jgi:hypothetical protein
MSCSPCTIKHFLGCFDHCSPITGLTSDETGTHVLTYEYGSSINSIDITATAGVEIQIPNTFNETALICFTIKKPSGANLVKTVGVINYECFAFNNKL